VELTQLPAISLRVEPSLREGLSRDFRFVGGNLRASGKRSANIDARHRAGTRKRRASRRRARTKKRERKKRDGKKRREESAEKQPGARE